MDNEHFDFSHQPSKQNHSWGQIFTSLAAVVITIIGAKIEGFNWILYLTVPILFVAFIIMISDTVAVNWLRKKLQNSKDKKAISLASDEYIEYLEKFKVVDEIIKQIQSMEWGKVPQRSYYFSHNRLSELSSLAKSQNHSKLSKAVFINHSLNVYLDAADKFIQECDWLVVQREVAYKSEHDKPRLLKLIQKYDLTKEQHNNFCSKINKKSKGIFMRESYEQTFSFMPKELVPTN